MGGAFQVRTTDWLVGGGRTGDWIRSTDWSRTPLGPRAEWPLALRTVLNLVVGSPLPMALLWGPDRVLLHNDACLPLLCEPGDSLRVLAARLPECWQLDESSLAAVVERGETVFLGDRVLPVRRGGREEQATFGICCSLVRTEDGAAAGVLVVLQETTRQTAERARLAEERERAVDAFEHGEACLVLDSEFRILQVNQQQERISNTRREETLGRCFWDVFPPAAHPDSRYFTEYHRAMRERVPVEFEEEYPPLGIWTDVRVYPTKAGGIAIFFHDATARKRAEAALRESGERFRQLADAMPQLVWTARPDGTVDYYNERIEELSGARRREDGSWAWEAVLHADDRAPTVEAWERAIRTGTPYEIAHRVKRADGTLHWYLSRGLPVRDAGGRVVRWYGTATDIDAQKRAEEALREADHRKSEFLAMLSHELRNPLAPIRNSLYVLERAVPGGQQAKRAHDIIGRQVLHMVRLIDDLLDVTRISSGKIRLQRERVNLCELVHRTAEDHRSLFSAGGVQLEVTACEEPLAAYVDPTRISQVIGNLLGNAAKFTPRRGLVSLVLGREDGMATIQVRDTGAGIPAGLLEKLFEPFVQADATLDRSKGGLGLGLALVKGLVELHGGKASVRSDGPGRGAEFTLRIPLGEEHVGGAGRFGSTATKVAQRGLRILLIEDNTDAAESLKAALELNGHHVETAISGTAGIERARATRPQVVLCDLGLPGIDGFEVARRLRSDPELGGIPLVALSGYAQPEDLERSKEVGFVRHLAKPPDLEVLEATLAEVTAK